MLTLDDLRAKGWTELPNGEWVAPGRRLGGLVPGQRTEPARPLEPALPQEPGRKTSIRPRRPKHTEAQLVVRLISFRRRLLDDDNLAAGLKPLRDAVAEWLGLDDGDEQVEWECCQVVTRGQTGTVVLIQI